MPVRNGIKGLFRRSVKTPGPPSQYISAESLPQQIIHLKQSPHIEDQHNKTATPQTLELKGIWKEAYEALCKDDARLIKAYEDALLQQDDLGSQKSLAESNTDTRLRSLVKLRFAEIESSRLKITFAGKEITVREQARRAIDLIISLKPSIAIAVGADPHAALAWAGIMLLLAPISRTLTQDESAMEGFEYILKVLVQYRVLESTHIEIYSKEPTSIPGNIKPLDELGASIRSQTVKLYVAVLRYQMRLAQHFAQSGLLRFFTDLKMTDDWDNMLQSLKKVDESINRELNTLSSNTLRQVERKIQKLHDEMEESRYMIREAIGETKTVKDFQLLDSLTTARHWNEFNRGAYLPIGIFTGSEGWLVQENLQSPAHSQQALYDVAFSPDGKSVASSSVCLYDAATGTLLKTLDALGEDGKRSEGSAVAFSPDGKCILSISWQGTLTVWDVSSGMMISEVKSAVIGTTAFWRIFSRDRTLAVALLHSNTIEVIDIANGRLLKTFQPHEEDTVASLALTQDGKTLASTSRSGAIRLWDTVIVTLKLELKRSSDIPLLETRITFSPDGKWLAALSQQCSISLWNPVKGELLGEIPGWFYDACFLPDSKVLVTSCENRGGDSGLIKLWDVSSRKLLQAIPADCLGLQLSPDGRFLTSIPLRHGAYGSHGGGRRIDVWDITTGKLHRVFHSPSDNLGCISFSKDNKLLASASDLYGTIQLWDLSAPSQALQDFQQHGIDTFKLSPNRKIAASNTNPYSKVFLWDMETGALRGEIFGGASSFSPDGKWFVTSNGKTDDICNLATMDLVHGAEKMDPQRPGQFVFSPDSKLLAQEFPHPVPQMEGNRTNEIYADIPVDQSLVRIWETGTWKPLFTFEARYSHITTMTFSPDSALLAGAVFEPRAEELSFIIWDVITGYRQRVVTFPVSHSECFTADLAWSPDGTTVAMLTTDRKVRLCHLASGQVKTLDMQERGVSVSFSSDGLLLATGSRRQGCVELWDVQTGASIGKRRPLDFKELQFSEDCKAIETVTGRIDVDAFYPGQELARRRDFLVENDWVVYGGKRILLLPIDFRATCAVAAGDLLLMGHASGRVTSLRIDATSFGFT
ncbi:hypothetical protein N7494_006607 [Penicillium frequentans]|uniref:Mitochondrial division protein 1 n=1 Tax=Penicillium frequentans TaxID=3151616 RepID=A0AAD6GGQ9_9EURO|nr:hypothetical protein N7494_006607 [Penicillium glabrum]